MNLPPKVSHNSYLKQQKTKWPPYLQNGLWTHKLLKMNANTEGDGSVRYQNPEDRKGVIISTGICVPDPC